MNNGRSRVRILSVPEFAQHFGTVGQCLAALQQARWPDGFVCPACGHRQAVFCAPRRLHQCRACRRQTSLTAGTLFHKSRIELPKWFWAIYQLAQDKKGCSARLLSKQLDVCYPTAWLMAHKIRQAMATDSQQLLQHLVELDDAFLGGVQPGRRGRGARHKAPLLLAVERLPSGRLGQAAIEAVPQLRQSRLAAFAARCLSQAATIRSDAGNTFFRLAEQGFHHIPEKMAHERGRALRRLPAVHLLISNLKRFVLGRHHSTAPKHAPRYVAEFVCRFNHRDRERSLFQHVLTLGANVQAITYPQLVAAELR